MLNLRAAQLCDRLEREADGLRILVSRSEAGTRIFDCGVNTRGGLEAGRRLAEVCLAGLGQVAIVPGQRDVWPGPAVTIRTDQPLNACMAAQYAGWQIAAGKFFAMGSGPMRALAAREPLFEKIGLAETSSVAVGVLETGRVPPPDVLALLADQCRIKPENLTVLFAPTASLAGSLQVVARSVETALHKCLELGFDLRRVVSGFGTAPLPPVAQNDLAAIGRTNDAILYGGEVTLWVDAQDSELQALGPRIPSGASPDYGRPFAEIFARYGHDFYKIDPLLFSPATITLENVSTGRSFSFGQLAPQILKESFLG